MFTALTEDSIIRQYLGGVMPADIFSKQCISKPGLYIVNSDESNSLGTHWLLFYFSNEKMAYFFDSLGKYPEEYHQYFHSILIQNSYGYSCSNIGIQPLRTKLFIFCLLAL